MRTVFVLSLIAAGALALPALAQPAALATASRSDAALAAKLAHDAEIADQDRRSEALNVEVNRKNREVTARNAATAAAYDKAMADYRAARAQHDAQVQAMAADAAKAQAAYQKSMDDWNAAVAACKAGDVSRCQAQPAAQTASAGAPPRPPSP